MKNRRIFAVLLCFLCLWGCAGQPAGEKTFCQVFLEAGKGFSCDADSLRTVRGGDVTFNLRVGDGAAITAYLGHEEKEGSS